MRVLITGVSGFVGTHLAEHLTEHGHEVAGLATDPAKSPLGTVSMYSTDVTDADALARSVDACDPDAVIHLAGLSSVGESWNRPGDYLRVNFSGTRNLVHAAEGRRILFASSAEVYGNVPDEEQPIREERRLDPRSPYAMTKACAEEVARDHGAIVVRSFNSIGPGQDRKFALPSFASQLAEIELGAREAKIHVGDLSPRRDFLHVEDAVRGYRAVLEHGEDRGVYNLASGTSCSIAEALEALCRISGVEAEIEKDPARVRVVDIPLLEGDVSRLRALGWEPEHEMEDALRDLWSEVRREIRAENGAPDDDRETTR